MKASSLSVCIPVGDKDGFFCNKNCPYCISKMTGFTKRNEVAYWRNLTSKVKHVADLAQVNSVIITGKTEPLLDLHTLYCVCNELSQYPLELQTNGILLNGKIITELAVRGVNTIAVSVDDLEHIPYFKQWQQACSTQGITLRATINLTNQVLRMGPDDIDYRELAITIVKSLKESGVDQVSFRKVTIPNHALDTPESWEAQKWINENTNDEWVNTFLHGFDLLLKCRGTLVSELPFGAKVYMYEGVSCTTFGHCIQEKNDTDDIRSLVYYEDGHLSTSWYGSNFGRVF